MKSTDNQNIEHFRAAMQREFIDRCRRNPAYSLRAYAKYLEIDQSFLSKLLRGHRAITQDLAEKIGPKLGFKLKQINSLFQTGVASIPGFLSLADDEFEVLSEWHHFAILELAKTDSFCSTPNKIASRLGIHVEEVRSALERLQRLNFIRISEKGIKVIAKNNTWTNTKQTSSARKKLQKTLLQKGLEAIDHVPFECRENGSLTVAINSKRIPEFKEKLKEVRKELAEFFQPEGKSELDEVYQLTFALFPLTKVELKNQES